MCLHELRCGQTAIVDHIPNETLRAQLLRFGIASGSAVICHAKLPLGPVVLRFGGQEIALGRRLAEQVRVYRQQ